MDAIVQKDELNENTVPSAKSLVETARGFVPQLRAQQADSNARGCYSPELHEAFKEAGFYKICQPKAYGGYEYDLKTFYKVMVAISTGHPAAGWCLALGASHAFVLASHWGKQAQDECFASGHFIAPHRATPDGTVIKADGGYRISGQWRYASGVPYSTHFIGNAMIEGDDGALKEAAFIIPRSDYTILDDWGGDQTVGMQASGSNSVLLDDVFVPDYMFTDWDHFYARPEDMVGGTPGTRLHGNPMYLGRLMGPYHASLVAPVIGAARAALEEYEASLHTQKTIFPPVTLRKHQQDFQRNFGYAMGLVDSAELLLYGVCEEYAQRCEDWEDTGALISVEDNLRSWATFQQAGKLACDAVEMLYQSAGSSASRKGHPLARYMGDVQMYRGHVSSQYLGFANYVARARLKLPIEFEGL